MTRWVRLFSILLLLIGIGFLVTVFLTIHQSQSASRLITIIEKAAVELHQASDLSKRLLTPHFGFDVELWGASLNRLNRAILSLNEDPAIEMLSEEAQARVERLYNLWRLSQWSSNRAFVNSSRMKDIVTSDFKSFDDLKGIPEIVNDPERRTTVNEMESIVINFDVVTKQLIEKDMNAAVEIIENEIFDFYDRVYMITIIETIFFILSIAGVLIGIGYRSGNISGGSRLRKLHGLMDYFSSSFLDPWNTVQVGCDYIERSLQESSSRNVRLAAELDIDIINLKAYVEKQQISSTLRQLQEIAHENGMFISEMIKVFNDQAVIMDVNIEDTIQTAFEGSLKQLRMSAPSHRNDFSLIIQVSENLKTIQTSPMLLRMILSAIFMNAFEAMESEPQNSDIVVMVNEKNGEYEISIADRGSGAAPEALSRAFEPFYSNKTGHRGTGLFMAYIASAQLGGGLLIENRFGTGCRLQLNLPKHKVK